MPGFFILLSPHLRPGSLVNRASDSGSEGRGFESHPGHKKSLVIIRFPRIFCLCALAGEAGFGSFMAEIT